MSMVKNNILKSPPIINFALYWGGIVAVVLLQFGPGLLPILAIFPMIIVSHGSHEAVHSTLVPHKFKYGIVNKLSRWAGFAILGQNFLLMQWSHRLHHKSGRRRFEDTIEQAPYIYNRSGTASYYFLLLGAAAVYYELAGYIYLIVGSKYHILTRQFRSRYYRNWEYSIGQFSVLLVNVVLYVVGGWKFVVVKLLFLAYWGMGQNVAHYGLPVQNSWRGQVASRTYRGPKWLECLVFGAGFYHLEHHLFPSIPGPRLGHEEIAQQARLKLGAEYPTPASLADYIGHYFNQLKGPIRRDF